MVQGECTITHKGPMCVYRVNRSRDKVNIEKLKFNQSQIILMKSVLRGKGVGDGLVCALTLTSPSTKIRNNPSPARALKETWSSDVSTHARRVGVAIYGHSASDALPSVENKVGSPCPRPSPSCYQWNKWNSHLWSSFYPTQGETEVVLYK